MCGYMRIWLRRQTWRKSRSTIEWVWHWALRPTSRWSWSFIGSWLDTNCPWTKDEARQILNSWEEFNLYWVEEPVNPPEDFESLSNIRSESLIPLAAGENACTSFEFKKMFTKKHV